MSLKMEFIERFFKKPTESFFLFGPRGTGKSLWTEHYLKRAIRVDFLQPDIFRDYISHPEKARELVEGNPDVKTFVFDEVQKVPEILSVIHSLIEKHKDIQFILTGSSPRKIKRAGVDLLGGRAVVYELYPFMAAELGKEFSLAKSLEQGLLPLVWPSKNPQKTLAAYYALYLKEEVKMEALVRNIGSFSRFLESISFSHGSVINISNIARDCAVERKTVEGYINVVEDLLLGFRLPIFKKKAKRSLAGHDKFYFCDTGIFQAIRPKGPLDEVGQISGAALEGLVAQHLRAWISYRGKNNTLYYWRTRSGVEVDFIIYGEDGLWAFEVKNSSKVNSFNLRALKSFKEDYPQANAILLYNGNERLKIDNILCIPCEDFLSKLKPANLPFTQ